MGIFVSVPKLTESLIVAVIYTALICLCSYRTAGVLQAFGYRGKRFFKWLFSKKNLLFSRYLMLGMLCALGSAVSSVCFSFAGDWAAIIGLGMFFTFCIAYFAVDLKHPIRASFSVTPRYIRLFTVYTLITAVFVYFAVTLLNYADFAWGNNIFNLLRYSALGIFPVLIIPVLLLANVISKIYEVPHNAGFVKKAKKKLSSSVTKTIGITGSYAKTSVKKILFDILSQKYSVLTTPSSYNTPMGLALTVNGNNLPEYDVFIAEMGARHLGDIAELCELCPPDIAVITGICPQHFESFKGIENIVKAKGEILNAVRGEAFIAADCFDMFKDYECEKHPCAEAEDIVCTSSGTDFTLTLGGEKVRAHTKLLGKHSAQNIALAAAVAFSLGMTAEEIAAAVEKVEYVEHRLQPIKAGGINILDDGYNSNVKGAAAAIEVLNSFEGRKIVVTPGLVELGILEESENKKLGAMLVGLDLIVLVGEILVSAVKQGYLEAGGDSEKVIIKATLGDAKKVLKENLRSGDNVLFLNDVPEL